MRASWLGFLTLTLAVASSASISCGHKPAYSDIQSKDSQGQRPAEQPVSNSSDQPAPPPTGETQGTKPEEPASPPPAPPTATAENKPTEIRLPSFIDQATGQFKDLPSFPKAQRTNAQFGPVNGADTGMFLFETSEPFQSIAAFYDNAIKKHGWIVTSRTRDPEHLRWELVKGKTSEALVEVKGEANSNRKGIILSRAEKPPGK